MGSSGNLLAAQMFREATEVSHLFPVSSCSPFRPHFKLIIIFWGKITQRSQELRRITDPEMGNWGALHKICRFRNVPTVGTVPLAITNTTIKKFWINNWSPGG